MCYLTFLLFLTVQVPGKTHQNAPDKPQQDAPNFSTTSPKESVDHLQFLSRMLANARKMEIETGNAVNHDKRVKAICDLPAIYVGFNVKWPMTVQSVSNQGVNLFEAKHIAFRYPPDKRPFDHKEEWTKKLKRGDTVVVVATVADCSLGSFDGSVPMKIVLEDISLEKYTAPKRP